MTADEAVSELLSMPRDSFETWCTEAYADIFGTHAGKWLCKYSTEKLAAWFLMYYVWNESAQEWQFTPAVERFSDLVDLS
jgi:hypothetical protein